MPNPTAAPAKIAATNRMSGAVSLGRTTTTPTVAARSPANANRCQGRKVLLLVEVAELIIQAGLELRILGLRFRQRLGLLVMA